MPLDSKYTESSFSPNLTDLLCLQLVQVPRPPDLAIFVSMMTATKLITLPLAHAHGVTTTFFLFNMQYHRYHQPLALKYLAPDDIHVATSKHNIGKLYKMGGSLPLLLFTSTVQYPTAAHRLPFLLTSIRHCISLLI